MSASTAARRIGKNRATTKHSGNTASHKGMNGMAHRIFLTVQAGCAEVCEDTLPRGVVVEILDFDGLAANPVDEMSAWLPELLETGEKIIRIWGALCGQLSVSISKLSF